MKKQPIAVDTTAQATNRQPYEAPKATFVPLKQEERLLSCVKISPATPYYCKTSSSS